MVVVYKKVVDNNLSEEVFMKNKPRSLLPFACRRDESRKYCRYLSRSQPELADRIYNGVMEGGTVFIES